MIRVAISLFRLSFARPDETQFPALKLFQFIVRGCLAPLTERFRLFPSLRLVSLGNLNLDERDLPGLLESLKSIPDRRILWLLGNPLGDEDRVEIYRETSTAPGSSSLLVTPGSFTK